MHPLQRAAQCRRDWFGCNRRVPGGSISSMNGGQLGQGAAVMGLSPQREPSVRSQAVRRFFL